MKTINMLRSGPGLVLSLLLLVLTSGLALVLVRTLYRRAAA